uniref:G protein-regulated inducer of neurite outgrowth C-terminal domain-containing protein n=1 Tax=Myripristis murdjan TaxID=586833 RepID=A0A668APT5_9TELE
MGSLKDEMRGLTEDRQRCEMTEVGEYPCSSDSNRAPEGPQINTSQESATQEDYQSKLHMNTSCVETSHEDPTSKDPVIPVGSCSNIDHPDLIHVKDCTQSDITPLTQQPDEKTTLSPLAKQNEETVSTQSTPTDLSTTDEGAEAQGGKSQDKDADQSTENEAESQDVALPVSPAPDASTPFSPAPFGQHHMRTQVSLEVVQCQSAATSPMTPPEGDHSFFFPNSFGRCGAVGTETKDAELQVGQQVEFCSVATSPMTPKTPAFPEFSVRETGQVMEERTKKSVEQGQNEHEQKESFPVTKSPDKAKTIELIPTLKFTTPEELNDEIAFNSNAAPATELTDSQVTPQDSDQQCKQHTQRMGSMDQDITILVTHYDNTEEEDEERGATESSDYPIGVELVKIDECHEVSSGEAEEKTTDEKREGGKDDIERKISSEISNDGENVDHGHVQDTLTNTNLPQINIKTEDQSHPIGEHPQTDTDQNKKLQESGVKEAKEDACLSEELKGGSQPESSLTKPPSSPAPSGHHHIHTQVSLEVVQCHSAATSPMTPPDGEQAFYFPNSFGKSGAVGTETKDAGLQVGQQVEFRSVATAPMTPKTPISTVFPEIRMEDRIVGKIVEEEEDDKKESVEPVQEVSWDEKGMTWEVYGAVVEVAVLGSAIQKHLEKQVKKHRNQPSMPPPPPLNPAALPLGRAGKRAERDGKVSRRRRNPFRLLMQNMQQPHCCSRAHTTE